MSARASLIVGVRDEYLSVESCLFCFCWMLSRSSSELCEFVRNIFLEIIYAELRRTIHFSCWIKKIGSKSMVGIKIWQVKRKHVFRIVNAGDINIKHKKIDKNLRSYKQFQCLVTYIRFVASIYNCTLFSSLVLSFVLTLTQKYMARCIGVCLSKN